MATLLNLRHNWQLPKYNEAFGTTYTKYHLARALCAENNGFEYDWDDDVYVCYKCKHAFNNKEEIHEHDCTADEITLDDFMPVGYMTQPIISNTTDEHAEVSAEEEVVEDVYMEQPPEMKIITIMFGTIPTDVAVIPEATVNPPQLNVSNTVLDTLTKELTEKLKARDELVVRQRSDGSLVYKEKFWRQKKKNKDKALETPQDTINEVYTPAIVTKISIAGGLRPSAMVEAYPDKRVHALSKCQKKLNTKKKLHLSSDQLKNFETALYKIMCKKECSFEIVGGKEKVLTGKYTRFNAKPVIKVNTLHETGIKRKKDLMISTAQTAQLKLMMQVTAMKSRFDSAALNRGTSGFVFVRDQLKGNCGRSFHDIFIVRGRINGMLVDARSKLTHSLVCVLHHYSSVAQQFWEGFTGTFVHNKPKDLTHECTSDFSVKECGTVSALITQTIFQFGKITCKKCALEFADLTRQEMTDRLNKEIDGTIRCVDREFSQFVHVKEFLRVLKASYNSINRNINEFTEIKRLIGDRKDAPFAHINKMNELLIKGNEMSSDDWDLTMKSLLELARYQNNRTENIVSGSLKLFRNKISNKAHVNLSLMCDNQLDMNGSFKWGKRQYHAKRFFQDYYDTIDPSEGYDKYIIRRNPNGSRKLAIGKLILSTNFNTLREQRRGEPIKTQELTQACVSKSKGNFEYPCCCVTLENGLPLESDMKMATKHHLVIGNSGDPKIVDLPKEADNQMYIAKEGYCYINIYMAMLIDVSEEAAKEFTKKARDLAIQELGQWPTLTDVAASCYLLASFFPDTAKSELPRMLVDHETQTIHVIDSYGSLTTGYHVLKANTVSQLIKFADNDLQSEMKHYRVGGLVNGERSIVNSMKLLIKSLYRPRLMREILLEEPYILVLAATSPAVLIAMFNSGSLECAIQFLLNTNQDAVTILTILSTLAKQVSVARTLKAQFDVLNQHASILLRALDTANGNTNHSYAFARMTLERLVAMNEMDSGLDELGFTAFRSASMEVIEKSYAQAIQESWDGLPFCSKLRYMRVLFKQRYSGTNCLDPQTISAFGDKLKPLPLLSLDRLTRSAQSVASYVQTTAKVRSKIIVRSVTRKLFRTMNYLIPDIFAFINTLVVFSLLFTIFNNIQSMVQSYNVHRMNVQRAMECEKFDRVQELYLVLKHKIGQSPSREEFIEYVLSIDPSLKRELMLLIGDDEEVQHQSKKEIKILEKCIAFTTLILMMFDSERSDGVYKILSKFKGVMGTIDSQVHHQSLDDIKEEFIEDKETITFILNEEESRVSQVTDATFEQWWHNQLASNRVIPHYRTEGAFIEFTRATAATVVNRIAHESPKDYIVMGAVGSGKSTGLPHLLGQRGKVLMLEPTRPLAENVCKQLRGDPFYSSPTLQMRDHSSFGSSPVTIMTSGFAFMYFANNPSLLQNYNFIIFDEFHVTDARAMAFWSLLKEHTYQGKTLKVSATPPGRSSTLSTQHPVNLIIEETLTFNQFVSAQGTGANADITQHADNILVYVASYNEVDSLSKMLVDKGHLVTKVDGRTMKMGGTAIETKGTPYKKHFVVATNIIENGVTLDIEAVVDFGTKVRADLDVENRTISYGKVSISMAERIQRLGRVGRHKPGVALRIGSTEKDIEAIPQMAATEAAFLCFTYGLPVMTSNVSVSLLSKCTVRQAKVMQCFEITPYFTVNLVRHDGSMHQAIHDLLKRYKLRDSRIVMNKMAIPNGVVPQWLYAKHYNAIGKRLDLDDSVRIPFYTKDLPERLYADIDLTVRKYKGDAGFGRIRSSNVASIAYTLRTDSQAIPMTLKIIDKLIESEMQKRAHYESAFGYSCSEANLSIGAMMAMIKSRYVRDHSTENLSKLQEVKARLQEFMNLEVDDSADIQDILQARYVGDRGELECVMHQSIEAMSKHLELKGRWNGTLVVRDVIMMGGVLIGGGWMIYEYMKEKWNEPVMHQGANKRSKQRLRFREARDKKIGYIVDDSDGVAEHYFGSAYATKEKKKPTVHGMGKKTRRFVNMYGFDPEDYSQIRFVDPLTGATLDEGINADISVVQEHFGKIRQAMVLDDQLDAQAVNHHNSIEAYYFRNISAQALKVDLTPHEPLAVGNNSTSIAGYPERRGELRQTGKPMHIVKDDIPKSNEIDLDTLVSHEAKSLMRGLQDYNPIANAICKITNDSDGIERTLYGVGYGPYIIANQHLFKYNNGTLTIRSKHGVFTIKNTTQIDILPVDKHDILLIKLPKDFPPFPQKLRFRPPTSTDRVCLVGTTFQEKSSTSKISDTSLTARCDDSTFAKHWISTNDGDCGLPLVSIVDGCIVGLHSLRNFSNTCNFYAVIPESFETVFLKTAATREWVRKWRYNPDGISWGGLDIKESAPSVEFKPVKAVTDLLHDIVFNQSKDKWLMSAIKDNLQAVAECPNQLVTKHVVKGKCMLFDVFLREHPDQADYFKPLMGFYDKSKLNKEAYTKDLMKYATPIPVGDVDCAAFEEAWDAVVAMMRRKGFVDTVCVLDTDSLFSSLNMKAAVGALYQGKKKDYFANFSQEDKDNIIMESCKRLYLGKKGIWNGSAKAELRPTEKVLANKTRTFTAAPIDTLLGGKACVDDFNNQFYSLNIHCPWSVGMTKFYRGWDELLRKLPDGWIYCDADGSQFDSSLTPYMINAVLNIRLEFMEECPLVEKMLSNLYTEIIYTPISTPDGTVVKKFKGNNSGQPSTVVDNTLMVILAVTYSLIKLGYKPEEHENICIYFVNGDDLLLAVHPEHQHVFDEFREMFASVGLNYTFDSRTTNKEDLWFMSHRGVLIDECYIPKLEPERIVSILEWDRSSLPEHRLEAICAAMVESWGYTELTHRIRQFYSWVLEQAPYNSLAAEGKAPYIAETALKRLYTCVEPKTEELNRYIDQLMNFDDGYEDLCVFHQAKDEVNTGLEQPKKTQETPQSMQPSTSSNKDMDVNVGTTGTFQVPRLKKMTKNMNIPKVKGKTILNLDHLLQYNPDQTDLSNTRATKNQLAAWYEGVKREYDVDDSAMNIILNGLVVWCIENGTSSELRGVWTMMDGEEQIEYPIKPLMDHAQPSFRQIMAHFSDIAEAYIEKQNSERAWMPRYGLLRNITDFSLARYCFDFYQKTSKTPVRAREAVTQMKAAALRNASTRLFGLDGNVGTKEENTERHTAEDVNSTMHHLLGMRGV
uniref:Genome polyprotein n=1 Tax=Lettuce Italian necrotic virus TaxID=1688637 RepID=A0A1W5T6Y5_9POTV|nr:polyprotein [Lettuce Italian necrotic virus]